MQTIDDLIEVLNLKKYFAVTKGAIFSKISGYVKAVVDLPQPDSPTSPSVRPLDMLKLMPSTALTYPEIFEKIAPFVTAKYFLRLRTSIRSSNFCMYQSPVYSQQATLWPLPRTISGG